MAIKNNIPPRIMPNGITQDYTEITDGDFESVPQPQNTIVLPTEKHYERGVFSRHFVARYDSNVASEVKEKWLKANEKKLPKGIYSIIKVRWYLRDGVNKESRKILHPIKAEMLNRANIDIAAKKMPQLLKTIKDYKKYFR